MLALRIDLSVPADLDISTCNKRQFRSWPVAYNDTKLTSAESLADDGANSHHVGGQLDTVYMINVDRSPLVIDASHMPASSPADVAELRSIVARWRSIEHEPIVAAHSQVDDLLVKARDPVDYLHQNEISGDQGKVAQSVARDGCLHNHCSTGEGLATSPTRRARLRFRQPSSACETKEVRPRLTTAVP